MKNIFPADVPVWHYIEQVDNTLVLHRVQRMAPKRIDIARKEIRHTLKADIILRASSSWSFTVVVALKEDSKHCLCKDYRTFNRVLKADRFPLPKA